MNKNLEGNNDKKLTMRTNSKHQEYLKWKLKNNTPRHVTKNTEWLLVSDVLNSTGQEIFNIEMVDKWVGI